MMNVMKQSILLIHPLQWVPRNRVPAVIIHCFEDRHAYKPHCLARRELGDGDCERCAKDIDEEGFDEV